MKLLCSQGDYNLCEQVQFIGVYPYHGSMQRFLVHDARYVHKLPDNMSYEKGALVEPASVAYHAIEKSSASAVEGSICWSWPRVDFSRYCGKKSIWLYSIMHY